MEKLLSGLETYLMPVASKLGANKYLKAISAGFIAVMSATIVGSLFTLVNNLPISAVTDFLNATGLRAIFGLPGAFTTDCIAIYAVFFISYSLASQFGVDGAGAGLAGLVSFLILTGKQAADGTAIATTYLGAKGLFTAMIVALIGTRVYIAVVKAGWTIKLPDSVPPNVSNSFSALIPVGIVVCMWVAVTAVVTLGLHTTLHDIIFSTIQSNLMRFAGNNIFSYVFFQLMTNLLWFFGLHGGNIVGSITNPIYTPLSLANLAAYEAGETVMPYIITGSFAKTYMSGGVGSMFGLAIDMCLFAKSEQMKTLGKLALPTTMFFINEPLLFGIPVVLNPLYFFPLMLLTPILGIITYNLMKIGLVPIPHGLQLPWTTPAVINGFLQGGIRLAIYEALTVMAAMAAWFPFMKISDNQALKEEQGIAE